MFGIGINRMGNQVLRNKTRNLSKLRTQVSVKSKTPKPDVESSVKTYRDEYGILDPKVRQNMRKAHKILMVRQGKYSKRQYEREKEEEKNQEMAKMF